MENFVEIGLCAQVGKENCLATCNWSLGNGKTLEFEVHPFDVNWGDYAGLYIFADGSGDCWKPLYIGKTESFKNRFASHEREDEALYRGSTAIHAVAVPQAGKRAEWEVALIQIYQPPMNVQLRQTRA
jgi:Nuclease subunit of the excinuclease complex